MCRNDSTAGASDSSRRGIARVQNSLHTDLLMLVSTCITVNYVQFTTRDKYVLKRVQVGNQPHTSLAVLCTVNIGHAM